MFTISNYHSYSWNALILTICPNSVFHCEKGIVHFSTANFGGSSIFNLELRNRVPNTLRLSKLDKFGPLPGFKGSFLFSKNNKNLDQSLKIHN